MLYQTNTSACNYNTIIVQSYYKLSSIINVIFIAFLTFKFFDLNFYFKFIENQIILIAFCREFSVFLRLVCILKSF